MKLRICEVKDGNIVECGFKEFKPVDYSASKWIREEVAKTKSEDAPQTTNGLDIIEDAKTMCGLMIPHSIGYFNNGGNNPYHNTSMVGIYTTAYMNGHGLSIIPENFSKICALFTARKTIKSNWINDKDEYSAPNMKHQDYKQWVDDSVIYTLFHSDSRQSSIRDVQYKGKTYQIENGFFFMSMDEMKILANASDFREMVGDIKQYGGKRHVYKLLEELPLSEDARGVLESARNLVIKTMDNRKKYHSLYPELHLNTWDAGYLQLKKLWQDKKVWGGKNAPGFDEFREKYLKFEKRMREGVYKFGFLQPETI